MNIEALVVPVAVTFVGSVLTFAAAWYWHHKTCTARVAEAKSKSDQVMRDEIVELKAQLAAVREAIVPISTAFQAVLIKELTHFHTPKMDALLEKLGPPYSLSGDEEKELIVELQQRTKDVGDLITESEKEAATMLPLVIKRVKAEAALGIINLQVKLVAIPPIVKPQ